MPLPLILGIPAAYWALGGTVGAGALWMSPAGKPARDATARALSRPFARSGAQTCDTCHQCPVCGAQSNHRYPDTPDYVTNNSIPQDGNTILGGMQSTGKIGPTGARIYRMRDGGYAHMDRTPAHGGKQAHIETYDKNGDHTGTICPNCGRQRAGAISGRSLNRWL